jgi:putative sigma-54 modulation protein
MRDYIIKKLGKLDKFFDDDSVANVTLKTEKNREQIEITIESKGTIYRAQHTSSDMGDSLVVAIDALIRQIRKNKTRLEKRLRHGAFDASAENELHLIDSSDNEYVISKIKRFPVKPMDVEEAILQMNLLGHEFYMFRNISDGRINLVYRRNDGDYALIEPTE